MNKKNISIVIPSYKPNRKYLNRLLKYLKKSKPEKTEILIIDGKNGLANAYNEGIKKARAEIIVTIHTDCLPMDKNALQKLINPFKDKKVVLTYAWIKEEDRKDRYYPEIPDGKFNAFRKSALKKVGLFDGKTFYTGGEDVDIWLKLKKIGKIVKINTGVLHSHLNYRGNKTLEKRKQNGSINGTLFRIWGVKNPKWLRALIMCLRYPTSYGKEFIKAFIKSKQNYRRND
ncbi:MAG: glycosyltransferase family 2 protein [Spirochaetes bacterium]|nr:glycosyltransferase family 2 protein [Spirochaetota bacterium]